MTVAVQMPQQQAKKDPLDQIQQALGIAASVYGIALDRDKTNAIIEQNRLAKQQHSDETNRAENYKFNTDYEVVPQEKIGTLSPEQAALVLPKSGIQLPQGHGVRLRSYGIKEMDQANAANARKEKSDETNAKERSQEGLFALGSTAELQYQQATSDKTKYDPRSRDLNNLKTGMPGEKLLKNNVAIRAANAEDAWIENFLRDASGAAISAPERPAYGEIYFPRPGDDDLAVANKEVLRKQKMVNALTNSGKSQKEAEATVDKFFAKKTKEPPYGPTVNQNGHTYTWDPATGEYK